MHHAQRWSNPGFSHFKKQMSRLGDRMSGLRAAWERLSDGLALSQLWDQFQSEARMSYGLYSKDVDWSELEGTHGVKRWFRTAKALFWAMLKKLSPARRIFLVLALVLAAIGWLATPNQLGVLATAALLLLIALELADRVTMKRDLEIAREIQRWLVPAAPPVVPGIDIAFATRPANTVSGDYYDAFLRPPEPGCEESRRLMLAVADVAGKSVPAALLMATIQASLRTLAVGPESLAELVAGLNRYTCAHSLGGLRFTTAFIAELDTETMRLAYVNAGHNAPVLRRSSGALERLETGGLPLGIMPQAQHECAEVLLRAGDMLAITTDGIVEAENGAEEPYGEARLLKLFVTPPGAAAAAELARLMASVDDFVGGTRQHDDITCLVMLVGRDPS